MKLEMNKRIEITLRNLQIMEKVCSESKKGFEASPAVCMYLIECLLPIVDIYPIAALQRLSVTTAFNNAEELLKFLDDTTARMKRAENYSLNKEEIGEIEASVVTSVYNFIVKPNFNPQGQLEQFLRDLLNRLTEVNAILTDPRRSKVKISYLTRTFTLPINQIAAILEALCAGIN